MAFCPSCGKMLPPTGVCDCGYNANAGAAPQNYGQQAAGAGAPGAAGAAGSGAFGEAINVFVGAFKNPATNSQGVFIGKISPTAGFILGGAYCLLMWITLMLMFLGKAPIININGNLMGMKFLPAFLFGLLGAVVFVILRFISSIFIYALSKNNAVNIPKIFAAQCIDTVLPGCILLIGSFFTFISLYFAVFFFILFAMIIVYQQIDMLKKLSGNINNNKLFIRFVLYVLYVALILTILYLCYVKITSAQGNFM